jgi:prepilin-type N-terminal cleavage/methylation domain-containing protein
MSPAKTVGPIRRDRGVSLIEILIAVVLLGTVVAATLSLLIGTITGTTLDRDHANAHAWLQTASDMLYARDLERCDRSPTAPPMSVQRANIMARYQTTVQETKNPEGWPTTNIQVIDLDFWHFARAADNNVSEAWVEDRCTTDLQRVGLRVRNADGRIVEEVEVVIGGE